MPQPLPPATLSTSYLDGSLKGNGNLEWKGFNGSLVPIGDTIVMFYWQGGNPAIPAWAKTEVSDRIQVFAYAALTGKAAWKFEEACAPGTRGPGLVTGSGFWVDKREEAWALGGSPGKANFSLRCTELNTGKLQWSQPGFRMGLSMSAAEGRIYVRSHRTLTLVEANSHAHVEKGRIENVHDLRNTGANSHKGLLDWNMPVIARGRLFIRTSVEIICYDIRDRSASGESLR